MDALRLILLVAGAVVIAAIYFSGRRGRDAGPRFAFIRDLLRARDKGVNEIPELDISTAVRPGEEDAEAPAVPSGEPTWREVPPASASVGGAVAGAASGSGAESGPDSTRDAVSESILGSAAEPALGDLEALSGMVAERGPMVPDEAALDRVQAEDDVEPEAAVEPGEQLILVFYVLAPRGHGFAGPALCDALQETGFEYGHMQIFHYYGESTCAGESAVDAAHRRPLLSLANALEPGTFDPARMEDFTTPGVSLFLQLPGPLEGREAFERMLEVGRALAERLAGELCDDSRSALTPQTVSHLRERVEAFRFKRQMAHVGRHRK